MRQAFHSDLQEVFVEGLLSAQNSQAPPFSRDTLVLGSVSIHLALPTSSMIALSQQLASHVSMTKSGRILSINHEAPALGKEMPGN